ncbi:MAG: GNAT family N-acetyltransferase [Usitatibacter sp.]
MNNVAATTIRLRETDRASLQRHFTSLDNEDRRLRFGTCVADEVIASYVERLDFERDGLFAVQDETLELVAVVHVALSGTSAELGLSVIPRGRGKGLGNALFRRAVTFLRNRGAIEVFVHCLSENGAMMHLARKSGMRIVYAGSESDARLALEPATAHTLANEWFDDQKAGSVQAMRLTLRLTQAFFNFPTPVKTP